MALGERLKNPTRRGRAARQLAIRLDLLGNGLGVDPTFVPVDQYGVDRVHAFRVLAHSEVQDFLEKLALRLLDLSNDRRADGVVTVAAHHLLVYDALKPLAQARSAREGRYPPFVAHDIAMAGANLGTAIDRHKKVVKDNNGVKKSNVHALLLPLGYRSTLFAPGLLDQLDALGTARGLVAHQSGVVGTTSYPTGSDEWTRLGLILRGLDLVERWAPRLLRQTSP